MSYKYLLWTKIAGERNFPILVDNLFVTIKLSHQVASVFALVAFHGLGLKVTC